ncbi:hypothetical protein SO802_013183 [Lithocarpus litseifolius]|uniref:Fungal lipase-type domain-containing protein n=1 Tax=Lithocarpus litseifolius TaxID=425828 RepID=A0AAW2D5I2_9ROSI
MSRERDRFDRAGPTHLKPVDWNKAIHRRSVAASLVQGVYVQENDRQLQRMEPQAPSLAPPWWDFFDFEIYRVLADNDDDEKSIFGTIYVDKSKSNTNDSARKPRYVVAFRGNVLHQSKDTRTRDIKLDFQYYFNHLRSDSRYKTGIDRINELVGIGGGAQNIWLVGHSLGAAMAMSAGKYMAKLGHSIETYLFNPPFSSATYFFMRWTANETVRNIMRVTHSTIKAGLVTAAKTLSPFYKPGNDHDPFVALYNWFPHIFVNRNDPFCSGYIAYFEHRKKMESIGAGNVEKIATKTSMRSATFSTFGCETEDLHLLPSANLYLNYTPGCYLVAHAPEQWWNPDTPCQPILYKG